MKPQIKEGVKVMLWYRWDAISGQHIFGVEFTRYATKPFAASVAFELGRYFELPHVMKIENQPVKINFTRLFKSELLAEFSEMEITDIKTSIAIKMIKKIQNG